MGLMLFGLSSITAANMAHANKCYIPDAGGFTKKVNKGANGKCPSGKTSVFGACFTCSVGGRSGKVTKSNGQLVCHIACKSGYKQKKSPFGPSCCPN